MDNDTFYYTLSTIPQVLAAVSAVIAAFIHFRLRDIQNLLIGEGQTAYDRRENPGYCLNNTYTQRLRDAINRKNIHEIDEVLRILRDQEYDEGYTKKDRPTGLQFIYEDKFCKTEKYYRQIKKWALIIIAFIIFVILSSSFSLANTDIIYNNNLNNLVLKSNIYLFSLAIFASLGLVIGSFAHKTVYENLMKRDKLIRKNKTPERRNLFKRIFKRKKK